MQAKLRRAGEILSQQGFRELLSESGQYVLRNTSRGNDILLNSSKQQVAERMSEEEGLDDILETVLEINPGIRPYEISALQLRSELADLACLVASTNPRTVMEIGTANGGTLYTWCRYLDSVTDVISLDLPGGQFGGGYSARKMDLYRSFADEQDLHFVRANSHNSETFEHVHHDIVQRKLPDGSVDFLFIDGDHTYEGVKQDFEMYRRVMADDGVIALHDIVETCDSWDEVKTIRERHPDLDERYFPWSPNHPEMEVDEFWAELTERYDTERIIMHPKQTAYGIGIVYL